MYKKILVSLDGSELSEMALPLAEGLAGRLGSEITLVYVSESTEDPCYRMCQCYLEKMVQDVKSGVEESIGKPVGKENKVNPVVLIGDPAEEILDYASKEKFDLIVMATHGRSGIRRWVMGSVAGKVVTSGNQPIILVRSKEKRPELRKKITLSKILVPLDGSKESEMVLPYAEELASKFKAGIVLLRVFKPETYILYSGEQLKFLESMRKSAREYIEKAAARLKQKGLTVQAEFQELMEGSEAQEIVDFVNSAGCDIVTMSTHGRSGIGRLVAGSVAYELLRLTDIPVMLVRESGSV